MTSANQPSAPILLEEVAMMPPSYAEEPEADRAVCERNVSSGIFRMKAGSKEFKLKLSDLPADAVAMFREVEICDAGTVKTAYVLMTEPVAA